VYTNRMDTTKADELIFEQYKRLFTRAQQELDDLKVKYETLKTKYDKLAASSDDKTNPEPKDGTASKSDEEDEEENDKVRALMYKVSRTLARFKDWRDMEKTG
jgi:hypothetical protein